MATPSEDTQGKEGSKSAGGLSRSDKVLLPVIVLNLLGAGAVGGLLYYIHFIYVRPVITEGAERKRLLEEKPKDIVAPQRSLMNFEPVTITIRPTPPDPKAEEAPGRQIAGKLHYLTMAFSLELVDASAQAEIEKVRPMFMDRILSFAGREPYHQLVTVQGRYLLKAKIQKIANELTGDKVSNVFVTQYILQ